MRFVILEHHTGSGTHWDLMLEEEPEEALTTFSLPPQEIDEDGSFPSFQAEAKILPPHRREYLDYEGEISNDRGNVRRIAAGVFDVFNKVYAGVIEKTPEKGYILQSEKFCGILTVKNYSGITMLSYERTL